MRERLRRVTTVATRGVRTVGSPTGLRGAGVEFAWFAAHLALYPLGLVAERVRLHVDRYSLAGLPPVQRGLLIGNVEAAGTPILLVHGMIDNRSIFSLLGRGLRRRGFGRVCTMNYSPLTYDIRAAATALGERVERIVTETGHERIHLIGHSLGGIIARYYVQRLGGDERVHTLVTLGSPHSGTQMARLLPYRVGRQLRPGSDLMAELAGPAGGCRARFLAFWSDLDQMIVPKGNARLDHPDLTTRNVFVPRVGHLSLPIHPEVVREICAALAYLDEHGETVTAGVTTITAGNRQPAQAKGISRSRPPRAAPDGINGTGSR